MLEVSHADFIANTTGMQFTALKEAAEIRQQRCCGFREGFTVSYTSFKCPHRGSNWMLQSGREECGVGPVTFLSSVQAPLPQIADKPKHIFLKLAQVMSRRLQFHTN